MCGKMLSLSVVASLMMSVLPLVGPVSAAFAASEGIEGLEARYPLSRVAVGNPTIEGRIIRRGAVLALQADAVPANVFRATQANTKSPRFHVWDFARVMVGADGALTAGTGELTLARDTRLVVLRLEVENDRVRVFTHTAAPVTVVRGKPEYGCTEFVFALEPGALGRRDSQAVQAVIERWLALASTAGGSR